MSETPPNRPGACVTPDEDLDLDLLDYLLSLTPAERLRRQLQAQVLVRALRAAGAKHHGLDPRSAPPAR